MNIFLFVLAEYSVAVNIVSKGTSELCEQVGQGCVILLRNIVERNCSTIGSSCTTPLSTIGNFTSDCTYITREQNGDCFGCTSPEVQFQINYVKYYWDDRISSWVYFSFNTAYYPIPDGGPKGEDILYSGYLGSFTGSTVESILPENGCEGMIRPNSNFGSFCQQAQ